MLLLVWRLCRIVGGAADTKTDTSAHLLARLLVNCAIVRPFAVIGEKLLVLVQHCSHRKYWCTITSASTSAHLLVLVYNIQVSVLVHICLAVRAEWLVRPLTRKLIVLV